MEALIEGLGLDWKVLIAQIVNFTILLLILYKFAYKPLTKMLRDRSATIEKSLADAKRIEQELKATEDKREQTLVQARRQAQDILNQAKDQGEQLKEEMTTRAKHEVEKIVGDAHTSIAQAKEKMISEAKQELGEMVVAASEKVLQEKLDEKRDQTLLEKALKQLK